MRGYLLDMEDVTVDILLEKLLFEVWVWLSIVDLRQALGDDKPARGVWRRV